MKTLSALLLLAMMPSICDAQILNRIFGGGRRDRGGYDCPGGECSPSRTHPSIPPEPGLEPSKPIDFVDVPVENMPTNISGQCTWCAIDTVFSTAGYESTKGFAARAAREGWHNGEVPHIKSALDDAGIPYKLTTNGSMEIFDYARKEGVGVYIQIRTNDPGVGHAVAVVGMDDRQVRYVDNNGPKVIRTWTMAHFKNVWNGVACCPLKRKRPRQPKDEPKPETPIVKPAKDCNCDPAAVKALADRIASLEKTPAKSDPATVENTTNINTLTQNVSKLTELIANQSKSIDGLAASVSQLDKRVSALENRPGPGSTVTRIVPVKP